MTRGGWEGEIPKRENRQEKGIGERGKGHQKKSRVFFSYLKGRHLVQWNDVHKKKQKKRKSGLARLK